MLNAAEAAMDQAAEDDAARQRWRAEIYRPPTAERRRRAPGGTTPAARPRGGVTMDEAQSLMAQMAAQDAQFTRGRSG